jgi:hypothetical protein
MRYHPCAAFALIVVLALTVAPVSPAAAAPRPTAEELLDRYDKSMAALQNSRMTLVKRGETAYSWKASKWTFEEYTIERDERGRVKGVWRRRAPDPAPRERLAPEDAYATTFLWDGENYYCYMATAPSTLAKWQAEGKLDPCRRGRGRTAPREWSSRPARGDGTRCTTW